MPNLTVHQANSCDPAYGVDRGVHANDAGEKEDHVR